MRWRVSGAVVLLAVGAAGGWLVGTREEPEPPTRTSFSQAAPVPADGPEVPVEVFRQDPDDPALETRLPLTTVTLTAKDETGAPTRYGLSVQVPVGWTSTQIYPGEWRFTVPGNDPLAFGLRVEILGDRDRTVASAIDSRESELRSARFQGSFTDLTIRPDGNRGFSGEYVQDGYQRFSLERFFAGPDGLAYATVAAYGRARDVTGLSDLIERVSITLRPMIAE